MIRIELCTFFLILSVIGCAQQNVWKKYYVDKTRDFQVEFLHEVIDMSSLGETADTVRADLLVNNNSYNAIRFAQATNKNGEVAISIYETNEANSHDYVILISKNKFKIRYNYVASGESEEDGIIIPHETQLILNTSDLKVGALLKGHTEFKGKCGTCQDDWIVVKGNFEVVIK